MAAILTTPYPASITLTLSVQHAAGLHSPLQAFFFLNLGQDPVES